MQFLRRQLVIALIGAFLGLFSARLSPQTQAGPQRVALVLNGTRATEAETVDLFRAELLALGYVEGRNLVVDIGEAEGRLERLPEVVEAMIGSGPKVIIVTGSQAVQAARAATSRIPIVAVSVGDPVEQGLAGSLARPGGNVTGNALIQEVSDQKALEIARALVPTSSRIGVLYNPAHPIGARSRARYEAAGRALGAEIVLLGASTPAALLDALAALPARRLDVLIVGNDALFRLHRTGILEAVARHRLPTVYPNVAFVEDGGLISYGYNRARLVRNAASFVDRILKGAAAADLPFEQPTHFELVVNRRAADALGIVVPLSLMLLADRVLE